jgi:carbon storage regulator CsrA
MLVLTRKRDEKIQIGRYITVSVQRIASGHVRLGIEAPPGVQIMRGELVTRAVEPQQISDTKEEG